MPCDARGASGLRTARGLRALSLGGPRSAFGVSSVSPRSARVLSPSFTCLRRGRRTASSHTTRTRAVSCREPPWAPERRLSKRNAEFQSTGGIPRLLAELHGFSVNSTLFSDFQLLSPISTRHQVEFANSSPDRKFQPKTRNPRRLAPRSLGDAGRQVAQTAGHTHGTFDIDLARLRVDDERLAFFNGARILQLAFRGAIVRNQVYAHSAFGVSRSHRAQSGLRERRPPSDAASSNRHRSSGD